MSHFMFPEYHCGVVSPCQVPICQPNICQTQIMTPVTLANQGEMQGGMQSCAVPTQTAFQLHVRYLCNNHIVLCLSKHVISDKFVF